MEEAALSAVLEAGSLAVLAALSVAELAAVSPAVLAAVSAAVLVAAVESCLLTGEAVARANADSMPKAETSFTIFDYSIERRALGKGW